VVEWVKVLEDFIRSGVKANHRRMVVLVGSSNETVAKSAAEVVRFFLGVTNMGNGIYLYQPEYEYGDARERLSSSPRAWVMLSLSQPHSRTLSYS